MTIGAVREASSNDSAALSKLWEHCGLVRPWNDPKADIALALNYPASRVFVIDSSAGELAASVMTGFDGHRGWVYYVAVDPGHRGQGLARRVMDAAEEWLKSQGCVKVELIIRAENTAVMSVYQALGYAKEPRALMTKWLVDPPAPQTAEPEAPMLPVTITYLEMTEPPQKHARPAPTLPGRPLLLQRIDKPSVNFYRFLQHGVGDPWLWYDRRTYSDEKLQMIIHDDRVEVHVLFVGGEPAGFAELDFRKSPDFAELAYFGLRPGFIGGGLGPYLLDWAVHYSWQQSPTPARVIVNTCTLDHPAALAGYQKAGFIPYDREETSFADPVAAGIIPKSVEILSPGYQKSTRT